MSRNMAVIRALFLFGFLMFLEGVDSKGCRRRSTCDECLTTRKCAWCRGESSSQDGECVRKRSHTCSEENLELFYKRPRVSSECRDNGVFRCGQCECNQGYYGTTCECNDNACRSSPDAAPCDGHGTCICGQCMCEFPYVGQFCECDDFSCPYFGGKVCGGPNQGRCSCGRCFCEPGYTGDACSCPTSVDSCLASNGLTCNNKGLCICGQCRCEDPFYMGATCEECPSCPGRCTLLKPCVQCTVYGTGPYTREECDEQCPPIMLVSQLSPDEPDRAACRFVDEDDCVFNFAYSTTSGDVWASMIKECPQNG